MHSQRPQCCRCKRYAASRYSEQSSRPLRPCCASVDAGAAALPALSRAWNARLLADSAAPLFCARHVSVALRCRPVLASCCRHCRRQLRASAAGVRVGVQATQPAASRCQPSSAASRGAAAPPGRPRSRQRRACCRGQPCCREDRGRPPPRGGRAGACAALEPAASSALRRAVVTRLGGHACLRARQPRVGDASRRAGCAPGS